MRTYPKLWRPYPKLWRQLPIGAKKSRVGAHKFRVGILFLKIPYPDLQKGQDQLHFDRNVKVH